MKRTMFLLILIIILTACGKKAEQSSAVVPPVAEEPKAPPAAAESVPKQQTVVTKIDDKTINPLTGLIIESQDGEHRPYAVLINNFPKALPQSGISQADIFYEALAEGGITRILAVFQEYNVEKIGPVRSARHYFIDFAYDNDALFVHHGRSPQANDALISNKVENLDGMELEGTAFWRDEERLKKAGMYEHSSYTDSQALLEAAEKKGYRTGRLEDFDYIFDFYNTATDVGQTHDQVLKLEFAASQIAAFTYNEDTKLYERSQNGEPQIDQENGDQVKVRNVIVQDAVIYEIPGDTEGRRNIETISSGMGTLYTNGTMQPVKWSKTSHKAPTKWTDLSGNKLRVNKGKTWICVINE